MRYCVGTRIVLRPIELGDTDLVVRWRNAYRAYFFCQEVVTPDSHAMFMEHRRPHDLVWIAEDVSEPVGMVSLTVDVRQASAEFGRFCIDPQRKGVGLGNEIMGTALSYGFDILRLRTIWLQTYPENTSAMDLYQRAGWVSEQLLDGRVHMSYPKSFWEAEGRELLLGTRMEA